MKAKSGDIGRRIDDNAPILPLVAASGHRGSRAFIMPTKKSSSLPRRSPSPRRVSRRRETLPTAAGATTDAAPAIDGSLRDALERQRQNIRDALSTHLNEIKNSAPQESPDVSDRSIVASPIDSDIGLHLAGMRAEALKHIDAALTSL